MEVKNKINTSQENKRIFGQMYRSGWATKEGQERVLAIDIKRVGFNVILENAVLSAFNAEMHGQIENWKNNLKGHKLDANGTQIEIYMGMH